MLALKAIDADRLSSIQQRLAGSGRAQIKDLLTEESATELFEKASVAPFNVVSRKSDGHMDMSAQWLDMLNPGQKQSLAQAIQSAAQTDFQYLYDNFPLYDAVQAGNADPFWASVLAFLNSDAFLGLARSVTGEARIAMADAQLTRFRRGHFLSEHDDQAEGKQRYYAYVLNLTPAWKIDWGGLLAFHGEDGNVSEAFTPSFNTLNLLQVPAAHSVTQVALSAGGHRLSITGWLRGR
jgi:SM-20-related protein